MLTFDPHAVLFVHPLFIPDQSRIFIFLLIPNLKPTPNPNRRLHPSFITRKSSLVILHS